MRDIRILSMMMRDENVPATLSIFDDDIEMTTPTELDENEKDKLVKRFAERILQLGLSLYDWKEED
jgi:hypothetical protein